MKAKQPNVCFFAPAGSSGGRYFFSKNVAGKKRPGVEQSTSSRTADTYGSDKSIACAVDCTGRVGFFLLFETGEASRNYATLRSIMMRFKEIQK